MHPAARAFLKRFQLDYLLGALRDVFGRFPLSFLCCASAAALSLLEAHDVKVLPDETLLRTLLFLGYGLVFFTAAKLYAEGARLPRGQAAGLLAGGGFALLALCFAPDHFTAMHLFTGAALALSMLFAPYIGRAAAEESVWFYNYTNGLSLVIAGLSTLVLCLGLCAVYGSMDYLLYDMKLSGKAYGDFWIFGWLFFGPVAFMHQLSRKFDFEKSECAVPKGVSFIANYLAVPLVLVYTWVLYVYFLKIAVQWELPKGNLAYMVMGFGSAGSAVRLAVFPLRDTGTRLLQQFCKYFYWLLIVPLLLLAIGLYTRVGAYGVTEDRYAIGLGLAWLTLLTAWSLAKPARVQLKHVPLVLAALFLFTAAGPWGVVAVSTASQEARLERLLGQAGVLVSGKVMKAEQEVPFALRKEISSQLDYFSGAREPAIDALVKPFEAGIAKKYKSFNPGCHKFIDCGDDYDMPRRVMEAWGMTYVLRWQNEENRSVEVHAEGWYAGDELVKVAPYAYLLRFSVNTNGTATPPGVAYTDRGADGKPGPLTAKLAVAADGVLTIILQDGRSLAFPLLPLAEKFYKEEITAVPAGQAKRLVLTGAAEGLKGELHVSDLRSQLEGGHLVFESVSGFILFSP